MSKKSRIERKKAASYRRKLEPLTHEITPVYFLSVAVEDVFCFKDQQVLDLSDSKGEPVQWTVILGNNGVGKTTLLRCLAGMENSLSIEGKGYYPLLLMPELSSNISTMWQGVELLESAFPRIRCQLAYNSTLSSIKTGYVDNGNKQTKLRKAEVQVDVGYDCHSSTAVEVLPRLICYGYGATRRMGETSLNESVFLENSASLFSESSLLINAEEWLLQTDYAIKSVAGKTRDRLQKQFTQIIEVLKRILPEVAEIRITPVDEEHPRPTAEFLTPYGWVQLSGLGLGYRTMVAWMVDLAVRLFRRYPESPDPLAEPAIVLVDEIDLHLHPKWQRTIMAFLTERFPNTQFIVTAHSPLVVQAAKDANIVLLRREGDRVVIDNNPEIIDNWRIDQVLTSVFELPTARPADLEPLLLRRRELLSQPELSEADEAELRELEAEIGTLPTAETPNDIKAMDIIRRAAKLLENT